MLVQPSPLGGIIADNSAVYLDAYIDGGGDVFVTMSGVSASFPDSADVSEVCIVELRSGVDNCVIHSDSDHLAVANADMLADPGACSDLWYVGFVQYADGSRAFSDPLNLVDYFARQQPVSQSVEPSEQLYTRDEDLQIKGDFAFLGFALLVVLVLNLGANLFRAFRAR